MIFLETDKFLFDLVPKHRSRVRWTLTLSEHDQFNGLTVNRNWG